jgi:serine/threonine-protein kinase
MARRLSDKSAEVTLRPGSTFGRYLIVRRIGRGGMGAVYEGIHNELKKRVALKTLLPPMSENPELRARFLREGQAAARIRHPHVVDTYDVGELGGVPFLVMEYLEGEDLGALLGREGKLAPARAVDLLLPVCAAISAAHEEGVIHRDLKPANIYLARDRYEEITPKLLDFGISKLTNLQEGLTGTGAIFGTPFYMSPEQALGGKSVDARTDQYSLAVILYQCLTGRRPFEADSMYSILHGIVEGQFQLPRMVNPAVPEALEDMIVRAMAKNPEHRFENTRAFGAALIGYGSERTRAVWSHVFNEFESRPATRVTELTARPAALAEPTQADLEGTVSPEPMRTIPEIQPPGVSRTAMAVAALLGVLLALVTGAIIWSFVDRPVQRIILEPAPQKLEETKLAEPKPIPTAPAEEQPVLEEPPVAAEIKEVRSEPKKKKKKVMTGSNNAPILE